MHSTMKRLRNFLYVFMVSGVCAVPTTTGHADDGDVFVIYDDDKILRSRMATECETPNHDQGYCIGIKSCPILLDQVLKKTAVKFLLESRCDSTNEDMTNPKVCCGKYNDYVNISTNTAEERNIFPKRCGKQRTFLDRKIYGGKEAAVGEYPWMAILVHESRYGLKTIGCMGFLVHTRYVITAAHCTHPSELKVRGPIVYAVLGEHDLKNKTDCSSEELVCAQPRQLIGISTVITHPDYDPKNVAHLNDIAIIHLKEAARLSDFVQPICLLTEDPQSFTRYFLSGWGKTERASKSNVKLKLEVPPFDKSECEQKYSTTGVYLSETQICAGGESLKDSCSGDSGGPLMIRANNGTWYASGIVSFGRGCGQEGWPGVYTSIVKFLPWIKTQITETQRSRNSRFY